LEIVCCILFMALTFGKLVDYKKKIPNEYSPFL
jgi:hypothetical protein